MTGAPFPVTFGNAYLRPCLSSQALTVWLDSICHTTARTPALILNERQSSIINVCSYELRPRFWQAVERQSSAGTQAKLDLEEANASVAKLTTKLEGIRVKSANTERTVRTICSDIQVRQSCVFVQ